MWVIIKLRHFERRSTKTQRINLLAFVCTTRPDTSIEELYEFTYRLLKQDMPDWY